MSLSALARSINADLESQSSMRIGKIIKHPDGYRVQVIDGQFLSNGRVSNWWTWRRVTKRGTLSKKLYHGYGW